MMEQKMNVAYILHSTEPTDGASKAFLSMMEGLRTCGVCPFAVVPDEGAVTQLLRKAGVPVLVVNFRASAYPYRNTAKQRLLFLPRLLARMFVNQQATKAVKHFLLQNKIDLVHTNTGIVRIGFDAARKAGIPHIYHIREYSGLIGIRYFPREAAFLQQLAASGSYSIFITKALQQFYGQEGKASSRVIYDGVLDTKEDMPTVTDKDYFLFAGRIHPAKGIDQLLQAYKQYATQTEAPLHLKIAGGLDDADFVRSQQKFIEDNGLTTLVELLGNRNDLADLMSKARAMIVSSPFEGFGFCMPEAQQQGCLVIARNTSGTKEQLDNAVELTGQEIGLRYETTEQLAERLKEVANQPVSDYDGYTRKAFEVVNQLYTKEKHVREVWQFYQDISC